MVLERGGASGEQVEEYGKKAVWLLACVGAREAATTERSNRQAPAPVKMWK